MVRLPAAANFRLYFLCRLALPSDEGGYTGRLVGVVSNYTDDGIDRSLFIYCDSDRFLQRESKLIEKMA